MEGYFGLNGSLCFYTSIYNVQHKVEYIEKYFHGVMADLASHIQEDEHKEANIMLFMKPKNIT